MRGDHVITVGRSGLTRNVATCDAGSVVGGGEHETTVRSARANVTANRGVDSSPGFARGAV